MDYTIADYLDTIDYKIGDGSTFLWNCFGKNAYVYTYSKFTLDGLDYELILTFDTETRIVYLVEFAVNSDGDKPYRCFNPEFKSLHDEEEAKMDEKYKFGSIEYEDYTGREHEFKNLVNSYFNKIENIA